MPRPYTQKRRAEAQAETRQRIVEATTRLHADPGPAATTVSMIAAEAGVQRHTVYAHFPEELDLFLACSGHAMEQDPLPDPAAWSDQKPGKQRLAAGLGALYAWYERNARLMASVLRDAERHEMTRRVLALRVAPAEAAMAASLGEGLSEQGRALLAVAMQFWSWRALHRQGVAGAAAAALMAEAVACAGKPRPKAAKR